MPKVLRQERAWFVQGQEGECAALVVRRQGEWLLPSCVSSQVTRGCAFWEEKPVGGSELRGGMTGFCVTGC